VKDCGRNCLTVGIVEHFGNIVGFYNLSLQQRKEIANRRGSSHAGEQNREKNLETHVEDRECFLRVVFRCRWTAIEIAKARKIGIDCEDQHRQGWASKDGDISVHKMSENECVC
jgi:hypothetical protein